MNKDEVVVHEINDDNPDVVMGVIVPKLRRSGSSVLLHYMYKEFMKCLNKNNETL